MGLKSLRCPLALREFWGDVCMTDRFRGQTVRKERRAADVASGGGGRGWGEVIRL